MKIDPNESAFPIMQGQDFLPREWGLSKREYIATSVLQGLISGVRASGDGININEICLSAIIITDTLIDKLSQ